MTSIARAHGGDGGGEDPWGGSSSLPTGCQASTQKKVRGKTAIIRFRKEWRLNNERPFPIDFDVQDQKTFQPIGDRASDFSRVLGYLMNLHVKYLFDDWDHVPEEDQDRVMNDLKAYFDLEPYETGRHRANFEKGMHATLAKRYSDRKYKFKKQLFVEKGGEEFADVIREDVPQGMEASVWNEYMDFWLREDRIAQSERNAKNREKNKMPSCHGTKSYAALRYETRNPETQAYPSVIDTFRDTHLKNKKGEVYEEATALHEQMVRLRDEQRGLENPLTDEQIMDRVLGTRAGYNRGRGRRLARVLVTQSPVNDGAQSQKRDEEVENLKSCMQTLVSYLSSQGHKLPPMPSFSSQAPDQQIRDDPLNEDEETDSD